MMLVVLNVPLIGVWVKLLNIPYKYLYPSALFFVAIGVYSTNNDLFQVGETILIGLSGYLLLCSIFTLLLLYSGSFSARVSKKTFDERCFSLMAR